MSIAALGFVPANPTRLVFIFGNRGDKICTSAEILILFELKPSQNLVITSSTDVFADLCKLFAML